MNMNIVAIASMLAFAQRPSLSFQVFPKQAGRVITKIGTDSKRTNRYSTSLFGWWTLIDGVVEDDFLKNNNIEDTKIVTLGSTYLAVDSDGIANWGSGIPEQLYDKLWGRQSWLPGIDVVTTGADNDSYFVQFADGHCQWCAINPELSKELRSNDAMVDSIALGPNENYFCLWRDGSYVWSGGVPVDLYNQLKSRRKDLPGPAHVSLGQSGEWFVRYENGDWRCGNISDICNETINKIHNAGDYVLNIEFGHQFSWIITYEEQD